jgi:hypothetical protein
MGQLGLPLVVVAIGAVGWFIGKIMGRRAATVTGAICWCVALATGHYAGTQHEYGVIMPMLGSSLFALLGLGVFVAAVTERGPAKPQYSPLSAEDTKAAERVAANLERLRTMAESVPEYSQPQSGQTPSPKEPDPPKPGP